VTAGADTRAAEDYDLIYPDWDEAVERVRRLMAGHLPVASGRTLLDCTCGSGMTAQAAQELGWRVTGADASPAMLDRARSRLPDVELIACDVRSLNQVLRRTFDAVVSVGNTLLSLPRGDLPGALAQMRSRCKAGGTAMIVIRDLSERPRSGVWRDDALCRATGRFVHEGPKEIRYTLEISDAFGVRTHDLTLHPVTELELAAALEGAGFKARRSERTGGRLIVSAVAS
jgi:ubiquinone/menaquinone biosynthesis C-methylase UbiE